MGNLGPTELIIIAVVIILLFGAKKMPDMARSLGRSMRIIKAETKGMKQDDQDATQATTTATAATPAPAAPAQLPEAKPAAPAAPAAAQSDVEKMQKQIDDLQAQLKTNGQAAPTQAPKNA
ncbi:Sec-independent protein translocase subunit TatA [Kibdelosporangium philippinense]|uniref:Sec-independent protein translocase protein TatA n=1 Tax=Kibdelosporangium philippinense TaxID=211113 RepID=A0ABS8Z6B7_9PSEU|nr:Sec-independent protein translocase subunit TatA [Kibdelosporangium philippinense]MCE7003424.1 Sec-independent protein translocase subunit TatA [Kibdelosporangium philippinense]